MRHKPTITFLTYAGSRVEMLRRQGRKATSDNYANLCRSLDIENLTTPEIIRQYRILAEKHNCLI